MQGNLYVLYCHVSSSYVIKTLDYENFCICFQTIIWNKIGINEEDINKNLRCLSILSV